jgi:serine/threonine-protein kinase RsbT
MNQIVAAPVDCRVASDEDVLRARQLGRKCAEDMGFSRQDQALIATAISELTRNIVKYAGTGRMEVQEVIRGLKRGMLVEVSDDGPGIADIDLAMTDGYSTGRSLGLGLPGTRRMVDEFDIASTPGHGVDVTFIKWIR